MTVGTAQSDAGLAMDTGEFIPAEQLAPHAPPADALRDMTARKDAAYLERNQCVALIARMALASGWWAGTARTAIEGWSEDWHGCVYVDLPTGQVSWHYHDSQAYLFADLPAYERAWDGHDTPEKYRRVAKAFAGWSPWNELDVADMGRELVAAAERTGLVITIEQRPLQPLAMGHHETVVSVRPARGGAAA